MKFCSRWKSQYAENIDLTLFTWIFRDPILTGLKYLKIAKPYTFCDRGYSCLSGLSNLESLQIGHSWMLGAGLETLDFVSSLKRLRKLSITKCFVEDSDLHILRDLKDLQLLGICESNRITGAFLPLPGSNILGSNFP